MYEGSEFLASPEPGGFQTADPPAENQYHYALSSNQAWAGYKSHQNPSFFRNQASGETPSICMSSPLP